jgi:hypothetical protein
MQQRIDLAANWTAANPVLRLGEIGHEQDTGKTKIGDGATAWASLAYWVPSGGAVMTGATTTTSAPSAGGAGALPATPAGYVTVTINGVNRKLPYY